VAGHITHVGETLPISIRLRCEEREEDYAAALRWDRRALDLKIVDEILTWFNDRHICVHQRKMICGRKTDRPCVSVFYASDNALEESLEP